MGEIPVVRRASISSVTFIVPSWAANAAPLHGADEGQDQTEQEADE
jgi:hypothetical protein